MNRKKLHFKICIILYIFKTKGERIDVFTDQWRLGTAKHSDAERVLQRPSGLCQQKHWNVDRFLRIKHTFGGGTAANYGRVVVVSLSRGTETITTKIRLLILDNDFNPLLVCVLVRQT